MEELTELISGLERWLLEDALPLWWTVGADHERGGFSEAIDLRGRPTRANRRARVQARQTFVYAEAGALGWDGPWRTAMNHGLDYLLTRFPRPDGLFRASVDLEGAPVDEAAILYDQAFALFAMAAGFRAEPARTDLPELAKSLLRAVERAYYHDGVGLRAGQVAQTFLTNPHMHLLEAALAWSEIDADPVWLTLADRIVQLCLSAFIDQDTGVLREHFGPDWRPAPGPAGRIVEPGHQFEWAWLLHRWGVAREWRDARAAARRLFEIGSGFGVDSGRGVAFNSILDDLTPLDRTARLWPQTEWMKAAVTLADAAKDMAERNRLLAQAVAAVKGLVLYLDTPLRGVWRDKLHPSGAFTREAAPASSFYHIVCAIQTGRGRRQ
jgi:mannose/cellobiose epimerase-like protein (N-acyl-D-glucosamine 2-epimerase family)